MQINSTLKGWRRSRRRWRAAVTCLAIAVLGLPSQSSAAVLGETTTVAQPCDGSSNPTFYSNNHREVVTPGGRELALFDPDGSGQVLAWRDPGGAWQQESVWAPAADEGPNDRTASIALDGVGGAWVVWTGYKFSSPAPVKLRHISGVDAVGGPTVDANVTTVAPLGRGNAFVDMQVIGGTGYITWLQRTGDTSYALMAAEFSAADPSAVPTNFVTLYSSSSSSVSATIVDAGGPRIVARAGKIKVFSRQSAGYWSPGSALQKAPAKSKLSAIPYGNGILVAFQAAPYSDNIVKVVRFASDGSTVSTWLATGGGYVQPALAGTGTTAVVVMVKTGTQATVVSRTFDGLLWSGDTTELDATVTNGGDYAWPNTLRDASGGLRFLVDGKRCPDHNTRNAVLAYERLL